MKLSDKLAELDAPEALNAVPGAELVAGPDPHVKYTSIEEARASLGGTGIIHMDGRTGEISNRTTDELLGIDPVTAARADQPIDVRLLTDDQLRGVWEALDSTRPADRTPAKRQLRRAIADLEDERAEARMVSEEADRRDVQALNLANGLLFPSSPVETTTHGRRSPRVIRSIASVAAKSAGVARDKGGKLLFGFGDRETRMSNEEAKTGAKSPAQATDRPQVRRVPNRTNVDPAAVQPSTAGPSGEGRRGAKASARSERGSARDDIASSHEELTRINDSLREDDNKPDGEKLSPIDRLALETRRDEQHAISDAAHQRLEANRGRNVRKSGRSTGHTEGSIEALASAPVEPTPEAGRRQRRSFADLGRAAVSGLDRRVTGWDSRQPEASATIRLERRDRKAMDVVQDASHGATSKLVRGFIAVFRSGTKKVDESASTPDASVVSARQERNQARKANAKDRDRARQLRGVLRDQNLPSDFRAENEAELAEVSARMEAWESQKKAARGPKAPGNKDRISAERDAAFDEMFPPDDPSISPETRELFRDLHNKRITALKLGLETGYKLLRGKGPYDRAYAEYKAAYVACGAAMIDHQQQQAGRDLSEDELTSLSVHIVHNEMFAMQSWQYQLITQAKDTRRGRMALWYQRQGFFTKLGLGVAAGLATGGAAGLAGGVIAGAGVMAGRAVRSEAIRKSRAIATRNSHRMTNKDEDTYKSVNYYDAFDLMAADQRDYVRDNIIDKRLSLGMTALGIVGGALLGHVVSDKLHHHGTGGTKHDTASGGRPQGTTATTTGGHTTTPQGPGERTLPTGADRPRLAPGDSLLRPPTGGGTLAGGAAEHAGGILDGGTANLDGLTPLVSQITPGQGLIENLTHVGLNVTQATNATEAMRSAGLLDGSHIAGVAERAGNIVVYLRGAGDGALHFDDPEVLKIIAAAKNS